MSSGRTYEEKRNFDLTPEPRKNRTKSSSQPVFVVHRHEAARLHYDLRISHNGVLCSWAIPKGFSYRPSDKRLAVRTEDHPMMYESFEGMIPKGEYGAGTIKIWDKGSYTPASSVSFEDSISKGELKVVFDGLRLRGEWHLVKTDGDNWLLFKAQRDRYARDTEHLIPPSVEIQKLTPVSSMQEISPMSPRDTVPPFSDPAWGFELDPPGRRVRLLVEKGQARIIPNRGKDLTVQLPRLVDEIDRLPVSDLVCDATLVKNNGMYLHDILQWERWSTSRLSFIERKALLRSLFEPSFSQLLFMDYVSERGEECAISAAAMGIDTLIAKRLASTYRGGRSSDWRKVRISEKGEKIASILPKTRLTNPEKVYWAEDGITKKQLFGYYESIADLLIPHLVGRPVHLRRFPDGIDGEGFYQRKAPDKIPDWVPVGEFNNNGRKERYILCNTRDTLLYLINLGSIDLHPWMSNINHPDRPTWSVIDIDAKQSSFKRAIQEFARAIEKLLSGLSLTARIKTSGASGLHIFIPLAPNYSYEQSRMFAESISRIVASEHPEIATTDRNVQGRNNRIYIDFLQNRRGQTVVPPYVARPVPGARVSMPLTWDELNSDLNPENFTINTAIGRVRETGDLFRAVLETEQELLPAITALQEFYTS